MKEKIESKIKDLEQTKIQYIANVNGCDGAIQVLNDLLKDLNKEEEIVKETK